MTKETVRKCSRCGHTGHNSRSCNNNSSFKLFGVRITPNNHQNNKENVKATKERESMTKSRSTGSLQAANKNNADDGYHSDDMHHVRRAREQRKKGVTWTLDEHQAFLLGLEKLKKGDWKGISKNYVPTRTAAQVASHAQKHFVRCTSTQKSNRRPSIFDITLHEPVQMATYPARISLQGENSRNTSLMKTGITPIQVGNTGASSLKNTSNFAGIRVATSELPPLAPMATRAYGLRDFPNVPPHIVGYTPINEQSFGVAKSKQVASFFPKLSYMYAAHGHGIFPVFTPVIDLSAKPVPDGSSTRASVIKNDRLEAEVGALVL